MSARDVAGLYHGDSRDVLKTLPDNSIDSVVTDPPYALVSKARASAGFMGQSWDTGEVAFAAEFWSEVYRVLKPGGHVVSFGGTRTYHRMTCAIEDAGFEIRDQLQWLYGTGFPKSHDVSKAIDRAAGAEREVAGVRPWTGAKMDAGKGVSGLRQSGSFARDYDAVRVPVQIIRPATPKAEQWNGWGTALKPATEPICLARKPLDGTVAENVLKWGTGAINIDGCRVNSGKVEKHVRTSTVTEANSMSGKSTGSTGSGEYLDGRFPANVLTDGSVEMPNGAQRFFYSAKASKADRGEGNNHPTVKPTDLMRWLCRLVTPPGGVVLDPFMGSGSTGKAARSGGFQFVGIEREEQYFKIAKERVKP